MGSHPSTSPSSLAAHGGTAPWLWPAGRAAPTLPSPGVAAQRCRPGDRGRGGRLGGAAIPSQRTQGEPVRGSPRPDGRGRAAVPPPRDRRGEAGSSAGPLPGTGAAGGRAKGHLFHAGACEAEGGASVAGRRSGAHPRDGREGRAARSSDTRRGVEEGGHEGTRVVRGGRAGVAGAALSFPGRADAEAAPQTRPRPCAHLCCAGSRGHRGGTPQPPPRRSRPARAHLTSKRGPILFFSR